MGTVTIPASLADTYIPEIDAASHVDASFRVLGISVPVERVRPNALLTAHRYPEGEIRARENVC